VSALAAVADFGGLIDALARKAARIGAARSARKALARSRSAQGWRTPALLWPLFTMGAD